MAELFDFDKYNDVVETWPDFYEIFHVIGEVMSGVSGLENLFRSIPNLYGQDYAMLQILQADEDKVTDVTSDLRVKIPKLRVSSVNSDIKILVSRINDLIALIDKEENGLKEQLQAYIERIEGVCD